MPHFFGRSEGRRGEIVRPRRRAGRGNGRARESGDPAQHRLERIADPGLGHEVDMLDVVGRGHECDAAACEVRRQCVLEAHAALGQQALQRCVLLARCLAERTQEERRRPLLQPTRELVVLAVKRVEQHDAAQAIVGAPGVKDERGRIVAAAIGGDHDRRGMKRPARAGIAVELGQPLAGFTQKLREHARLPETAGAGIERVHGELRRHQHRIEAGFGDLSRHRLAIAHIAGERRFVAVEEHDYERGPARIEPLGDVQQHPLVAVGLVFPVGAAADGRMAAPLAVRDIEKRPVLVRHVAVIGERRHLEGNQRRLRRRQRCKLAFGCGGGHGDGGVLQQQGGRNERKRCREAAYRGAAGADPERAASGHAAVGRGAGDGASDGCSGRSTAKKTGIASR